jgi:hypothetical protein
MATTEPFALYDRFGFVLCSGGFIPRLKPDGGLDKGFSHDSVGWKDATSRRFLPGRPGYAILTGAVSGVTAVDVDDPEAPHNAQLIPLLRAHSNLIARTRKGFHFLFAYDARIRTVSNNSLGLDTRNDGGLLYVAPSHYTHPATGEEIAYTWERVPADDEPLGALPEAIVKQMTRLWANYVKPLAPPAETGNVAYYTKTTAVATPSVASEPISLVHSTMEINNDDRIQPILLQIPQERWDDYNDWVRIGMACFNEGCSLQLWDTHSQSSEKWQAGACAAKWATFRRNSDRKITVRTLLRLAQPTTAEGGSVMTSVTATGTTSTPVVDDLYACRQFVALMGDEIHKEDDDVYVYDPATGLWENKDEALLAAVHRHAAALRFTTNGEDGRRVTINYGGSTRNTKAMLYHLRAVLPDDTFISTHIETSLEHLLFTDGICHIPTKTFRTGFDKAMVFFARIRRPFCTVRNEELEARINQLLFIDPFSNAEIGTFLKMRLARSIAGCYHDKRFLIGLGDSNSSKGTLTTALSKAFEQYVVEWNANNLKYNAHSGADEAKRLAWAIPLQHARLAINNEARMDKTAIDGNLLKTLSSGGDVIKVRKNYQDEVPMIMRASFLFFGNDLPEITPNDSGVQGRVRVMRLSTKFVENPTKPDERKADATVKHKFMTTEWQDALLWVIFDAYGLPNIEPESVMEETTEWVPPETNRIRELLEETYIIDPANTADDNWTGAREIYDYIKEKGLNYSDTKVGRELTKIGLEKTVKKVSGKTIRVWIGIR